MTIFYVAESAGVVKYVCSIKKGAWGFMLKEYRVQSILGVWGGLFFLGAGYFFSGAPQTGYARLGIVIMTAGIVLFVCGCFMYAKGKGHSFAWGVLGFLGPLGLLLLYCLKDRSKMVLKRRQKELA